MLTEGWIRYYEDDSMETKKGELKLSRDTDIVSDDVDSKVFTVNNHEDRDSYLVMESEVSFAIETQMVISAFESIEIAD